MLVGCATGAVVLGSATIVVGVFGSTTGFVVASVSPTDPAVEPSSIETKPTPTAVSATAGMTWRANDGFDCLPIGGLFCDMIYHQALSA